ncbi:MAG: hypothetical protein KC458_06425 [Dehalococcoidia bacterium]|nr:hypothetical protein [Dehalococcoidia bacterium]
MLQPRGPGVPGLDVRPLMSQRKRLFALVFAVTAPLLLLAAAFVVISVRDAQDRAEQESEAIARAGAVAAGSFIDGHVRALQAVSAGVRHAPDLTEDELREEILLRLGVNPEWDGMSVVDSNGIVLAGSRPDSTGIDLSGRAYLQEMFATGRPAVSDGVLTIGEGVPSILIAAPVRFSDGTTGGVIGQLTLSTISDALTRSLTTDARVGLIDSAGQTLIHSDPTRAAALTQVSDRPEVVAGHRGEAGTVEVDRNGRSTLVAYAPVEPLGWVVTVAEDSSAAFANADAIARRGAFLIGIALVAVVACGWYVGSRMGRSYDELQAARTAEAEARERAEAALRSRDEFISIASHELRNPVAAIRGFGQLMQRRLARGTLAGDDLHEYIDSIASSGAYLSRLVEDLLSVSRLEGGRMDLRLEAVDVAEVVRRATIESPLKEHSLVVEPADGTTRHVARRRPDHAGAREPARERGEVLTGRERDPSHRCPRRGRGPHLRERLGHRAAAGRTRTALRAIRPRDKRTRGEHPRPGARPLRVATACRGARRHPPRQQRRRRPRQHLHARAPLRRGTDHRSTAAYLG